MDAHPKRFGWIIHKLIPKVSEIHVRTCLARRGKFDQMGSVIYVRYLFLLHPREHDCNQRMLAELKHVVCL